MWSRVPERKPVPFPNGMQCTNNYQVPIITLTLNHCCPRYHGRSNFRRSKCRITNTIFTSAHRRCSSYMCFALCIWLTDHEASLHTGLWNVQCGFQSAHLLSMSEKYVPLSTIAEWVSQSWLRTGSFSPSENPLRWVLYRKICISWIKLGEENPCFLLESGLNSSET